jgi:hypothetical protein
VVTRQTRPTTNPARAFRRRILVIAPAILPIIFPALIGLLRTVA